MNNPQAFIIERFKHLRQFYKTDEEYAEHLLSGEVTTPITEVIKILESYVPCLPEMNVAVKADVTKETYDFINAVCAMKDDGGNKQYFLVGNSWYDLNIITNE